MRHFSIGLLMAAALLRADFTLEQTSRMTGGSMLSMMRFVPGAAKRITEPNPSTTVVKGNKMAHIDKYSTQIWDLDAETITRIDHEKKEYSVTTFADYRQAMEKMMQNMRVETAKADADLDYKFDVKETGRSKTIASQRASEILMTMDLQATDKRSRQAAETETQISAWMAPKVAGYDEVTAFYGKMAQKLAFNPAGAANPVAFAGRPEVARGMAAVAAKMQKMNGTPVMQIIRMGPKGQLPPPETFGEPRPQQPESERPKMSDAVLGGLGGRFGLGRNKKKDESPAGGDPPKGGSANPEAGMLMEMTTETISVSAAPVDASRFALPGGYKQVEDPMVKRLR